MKPYTANGSAFSNPYGNPFANGSGTSVRGFRQATEIQNGKRDLNTLLGQGRIMRGSDLFDKVRRAKKCPTHQKRIKKQTLDYAVGDTVRHIKFGIGTVVEIEGWRQGLRSDR